MADETTVAAGVGPPIAVAASKLTPGFIACVVIGFLVGLAIVCFGIVLLWIRCQERAKRERRRLEIEELRATLQSDYQLLDAQITEFVNLYHSAQSDSNEPPDPRDLKHLCQCHRLFYDYMRQAYKDYCSTHLNEQLIGTQGTEQATKLMWEGFRKTIPACLDKHREDFQRRKIERAKNLVAQSGPPSIIVVHKTP
jgi:hypothetical protein